MKGEQYPLSVQEPLGGRATLPPNFLALSFLPATPAPSSLLALHLSFPPGAAWSGAGRTWAWDWRRPATASGTAPSAGLGSRSCRVTSSQQPTGAPVQGAGALSEQSTKRPSGKVGLGEL